MNIKPVPTNLVGEAIAKAVASRKSKSIKLWRLRGCK